MGLLQPMGTGQGYVKAGFVGFSGTGKTMTAALLACGTRKMFGLDGPIAIFDTEGGGEYVSPLIAEQTGKPPVGVKSRSFDDLLTFGKECVEAKVSVAIVDSMTHVWEDIRKSYMATINAARASKNLGPRTRLEFQDWGPIKDKFNQWTTFYLNSPLHLIVCGRAGFTYDYEENDETGKKELIKTGVKMKTEGEFGFEPSMLVEMDRVQVRDSGKLTGAVTIVATVIKDRFNKINGAQFHNPTFENFLPHVACLKPGASNAIDTSVKTVVDVDESGNAQWQNERRTRAILAEEIKGEFEAKWPGQSADAKKARAESSFKIFGTRSWTAIENMDSERLRTGLAALRDGDVSSVALEPVESGVGEAF